MKKIVQIDLSRFMTLEEVIEKRKSMGLKTVIDERIYWPDGEVTRK